MNRLLLTCLAALVAGALLVPAGASAKSSIRVGIGDQNVSMFDHPAYKALNLKRTRYFIGSDIMRNVPERLKARQFVQRARQEGVSTLIHISTTDLRSKRGKRVSTTQYRRDVDRIVRYFRTLGVRDFGAWNEVNHKTQETWNSVGHAVSYFKSMYRSVKKRCRSCAVVGLDILDQGGADRYMRSFYTRLSSTWRKRLSVVGIHNYSDINRSRSSGTARIIRTARRYNRNTQFWFTETGALAAFQGSFPFNEARQASRIRNMFTYASRFRKSGVTRVYSYNWQGVDSTSCSGSCGFDAGLVRPDGSTRPAYDTFRSRLRSYSR